MGCDIHLFVETMRDDGGWTMVDHPEVNRKYALFEKMAGVRGATYNAMALPRGLPSNVSLGTKLHHLYWNGDAHTESWLNLDEIKQLEIWIEAQEGFGFYSFGYMFGNGFSLDNDSIGNTEVKDIRFVFWFDN